MLTRVCSVSTLGIVVLSQRGAGVVVTYSIIAIMYKGGRKGERGRVREILYKEREGEGGWLVEKRRERESETDTERERGRERETKCL